MNMKKNVLNVVVDYVKDLLPIRVNYDVASKTEQEVKMDARALIYLSSSHTFFTHARNGKEYFYCFVSNELDINVAKYILRSNGLKPRLHISKYYHTPMQVLRVSVSSIVRNDNACKFVDYVMDERTKFTKYETIQEHLKQLRQKAR